jgi:hypothetical protein
MKSTAEIKTSIPAHTALRVQVRALEYKVWELQAANAQLVKRINEIDPQILVSSDSDGFVKCRGTLFKRQFIGTFAEQPYCLVCKKPMNSYMNVLAYSCSCGYATDFAGHQLREVMNQLP